MDAQTGSALGIAGVVSGVLAAIYTYWKHSSCKSNCCGKESEFSIDLTPVADKAVEKISIPPV
jgi:hypothetical protein